MKIKYYLRGLGVGIVITTLILLIVFNTTGKNISDEEIIARAKDLGMVMSEKDDTEPTSGKLSDTFGKDKEDKTPVSDTDEKKENVVDDNKENDSTASTDNNELDSEKDVQPEADSTIENSKDEEDKEDKEDKKDKEEVVENKEEKEKEEVKNIDETKKEDVVAPILDGTTNSVEPNGRKVTVNIVKGDSSRIVSEKIQAAGIVGDAEDFNKFMKNGGYADRIKVGRFLIEIGETYKNIAKILTEK